MLQPNQPSVEAHLHHGVALSRANRHGEALKAFESACALNPASGTAHNSRANALRELDRAAEALEAYRKAIELKPTSASFYSNYGSLLAEMGRHGEAAAAFAEALVLKPDFPLLPGLMLHARMNVCDWRDIETTKATLLSAIEAGQRVSPPWTVLSLVDSPDLHRKAAEIWVKGRYAENTPRPVSQSNQSNKLRIGYFSPDFRDHPVALLTAGLIEAHDRAEFEVHGFSYGPDAEGPVRQRLEKAFDSFVDIRTLSDAEAGARARDMGLDIAIDLAGFTTYARPGIFAARAAPVQASYLGYAGTMASSSIDYVIADRIVIPPAHRYYYTEKVVSLPCFQANDRSRSMTDKSFTRTELGLPEEGFVYCCFNNAYKIAPEIFARWMTVLERVPKSILWLRDYGAVAVSNLRVAASERGINPARLIFAGHVPFDEHLARHQAADMFLDTSPYNAHTTAADALWAGLPVLTCAGQSYPARVAASLLTAMNVPELIAATPEEYEAMAIALGREPARLGPIKEKIVRGRQISRLFDATAFARNMEAAFRGMARRARSGLPPEHIDIG